MSASAACRFGLPVRQAAAQDRSGDGRARLWGVAPDLGAMKFGKDIVRGDISFWGVYPPSRGATDRGWDIARGGVSFAAAQIGAT